jgi:hypothetical protein
MIWDGGCVVTALGKYKAYDRSPKVTDLLPCIYGNNEYLLSEISLETYGLVIFETIKLVDIVTKSL